MQPAVAQEAAQPQPAPSIMEPAATVAPDAAQNVPTSTPSPAVRSPAGWVCVALSMLALTLLLAAIFGDSWLTNVDEVEVLGATGTIETSFGLNSGESKMCALGDCETVKTDFSEDYDDCQEAVEDLDLTEGELYDNCMEIGDLALGGLLGSIFLWIAFTVGIASIAALVLYQLGRLSSIALIAPAATGLLTLLAMLLWGIIKPETDGLDLGSSFWSAFFAGVLSLTAGVLPILGSFGLLGMWWDVTPRPKGIGVRATPTLGEGHSEFVIRELRHGNETLSLTTGDDLLTLVTAKRGIGAKVMVEQHMMVKLSSLEAFSHYRFDWLDTGRLAWWTILMGGLIALPFTAVYGSLAFLLGVLLSVVQLADPEYITFKTSSGNYRLLVYRIGTNRPLTNASMDLIDGAVHNLLTNGELDSSELDAIAESIEVERAPLPMVAEEQPRAEPANISPAATAAGTEEDSQAPIPVSTRTSEEDAIPPETAPASASSPAPAPLSSPPSVREEEAPVVDEAPPEPLPAQVETPTPSQPAPPPPHPPAVPSPPPPRNDPLSMNLPSTPAPAPPPPPPSPSPEAEFKAIPPPPPVANPPQSDFSDIPSPPPPEVLESTTRVDKDELLDDLLR